MSPSPTLSALAKKKDDSNPDASLNVKGSEFAVVGTPTRAERQTITKAIADFGPFVPTLAKRDLPEEVAEADGRPAQIVIANERNLGDGLKRVGIEQESSDSERESYVDGRTQGVTFATLDVVALYTKYLSSPGHTEPGESLSATDLSDLVHHEFGHALDDRLAPDNSNHTFYLSEDPKITAALVKEWNRKAQECGLTDEEIDQIKKSHGNHYYPPENDPVWDIWRAKGKNGFLGEADFIRGYDSPSEQVANAFELYLGGKTKRAELKTKSPRVFAAIDHLFTGKQNGMSDEALAAQFEADITGKKA